MFLNRWRYVSGLGRMYDSRFCMCNPCRLNLLLNLRHMYMDKPDCCWKLGCHDMWFRYLRIGHCCIRLCNQNFGRMNSRRGMLCAMRILLRRQFRQRQGPILYPWVGCRSLHRLILRHQDCMCRHHRRGTRRLPNSNPRRCIMSDWRHRTVHPPHMLWR